MQARIPVLEKCAPPKTHFFTLSDGQDPDWLDIELKPEGEGASLQGVVSKCQLTRLLLAMIGVEDDESKDRTVLRLVLE